MYLEVLLLFSSGYCEVPDSSDSDSMQQHSNPPYFLQLPSAAAAAVTSHKNIKRSMVKMKQVHRYVLVLPSMSPR